MGRAKAKPILQMIFLLLGNVYGVSFSEIWNGWFIYAKLY
jgi:hypothetical protein